MVTIFAISAKTATRDLLKRKVFWNKDYEVIFSSHDAIDKTLSSDSNFTVDVVMWPKFDNSSIFMREVIITFYKDLTRKKHIFEGWPGFKFNSLGLGLTMASKSYTSVAKK